MTTIQNSPVTLNSILTKEQFLVARNEFRAFVKDPANKPKMAYPLGTKYNYKIEGNVGFHHFGFYAIFQGKDIKKVTHNVNSDSYKQMVSDLRNGSCNFMLSLVFESLDIETIKTMIEQYNQW